MSEEQGIAVDHGLDTSHAEAYNKAKSRVSKMLNMASSWEPAERAPEEVSVSNSTTVRERSKKPPVINSDGILDYYDDDPQEEPIRPTRRQQHSRRDVTLGDNMIAIENENIPVEITYPFNSDNALSVVISAMSVNVDEDSIAIMTDNSVKLKLPRLENIGLRVHDKDYCVAWVGGNHLIGKKFKCISFIVTGHGKESNI